MVNKLRIVLLLLSLVNLVLLRQFAVAKDQTPKDQSQQQQKPLANLDKILKQANEVKLDAIADNKLIMNVTSALNEMAMNLRKMFNENKRLNSQVQDLVHRVQNVTGVSSNVTLGKSMQQATNLTNQLVNSVNVSSLIPRVAPTFG